MNHIFFILGVIIFLSSTSGISRQASADEIRCEDQRSNSSDAYQEYPTSTCNEATASKAATDLAIQVATNTVLSRLEKFDTDCKELPGNIEENTSTPEASTSLQWHYRNIERCHTTHTGDDVCHTYQVKTDQYCLAEASVKFTHFCRCK